MHTENLGCPNCGSQSTQSMPMAYSQSFRLGDSGYRSISEFGQAAAPPPHKSCWFVCFVTAIGAGALVYLYLPDLVNRLDVAWLQEFLASGWPRTAVAMATAIFSAVVAAMPTVFYNATELPPLIDKWKRKMICRRCGHTWSRKVPG